MSAEFGVVRSPEGMLEGLKTILDLERNNKRQRFENALLTAKMIAVSALTRLESRGGHFRTDLADENPDMAKRSFTTLAAANREAERLVADTSVAAE